MLKVNHILPFVFIFILIASCGQKSEIKDALEAEKMAEAYGDGTHTIMPIVLPLGDDLIDSFDSPISKIGFILGGFTKLFANIGTKIGFGKMQMTLVQRIPDIPEEYIHRVNLKRVFFYIEPIMRERESSFWDKLFFGNDDVDFKFLSRMAIRVSSDHVENHVDWTPLLDTKLVETRKFEEMDRFFKETLTSKNNVFKNESMIDLIKYWKRESKDYLKNEKLVYIIQSEQPLKMRRFIDQEVTLKKIGLRSLIINKTLLVEFDNKMNHELIFNKFLKINKIELETIGMINMEKCTPETCFDFNVSTRDLMPIIKHGNAIRIDAFIEAGKVPESFQLKGFIEADVRMNLPF